MQIIPLDSEWVLSLINFWVGVAVVLYGINRIVGKSK